MTKSKYTIETLREYAQSRNGCCLSDVYINIDTTYLFECQCGYKWRASAYNTLKRHTWCPKCIGNARRSMEYLQQKAAERRGICLSDKYYNMNTIYQWQCSRGHIWLTSAANVINRNSWCKICNHKGTSKQEQEIYTFVKSIYPDALNGKRSVLSNPKYELDIWIPSLRKAIEYDGKFWHNSDYSKQRENIKNQLCLEVNISLLRISEAEYLQDKMAVFNKIQNFLAIS